MKQEPNVIFVTGGAGFIGTNFIRSFLHLPERTGIVNIDNLSRGSNPANLDGLGENPRYLSFVEAAVGDQSEMSALLDYWQPSAVFHFAAESHVDVSILEPLETFENNALGTAMFLEVARYYWSQLPAKKAQAFRFINISTDEVFGSLSETAAPCTEESPFKPNNPYAASKAAVDGLVRAYWQVYGFPGIVTHCTNNYGPFQNVEKLIPRIISRILNKKPLTVHGDGKQSRNWIHVEDHCAALQRILQKGRPGESYNIGAAPYPQWRNLDIIRALCDRLDMIPPSKEPSARDLISFVEDRPANDKRYALDCFKIEKELHWKPTWSLPSGLDATVDWYLAHPDYLEEPSC